MHKPQVLIMTTDPRLADVLCTQAALCRLQAVAVTEPERLPAQVPDHVRVLVLDLDERQSVRVPGQVRVLGLCRDPEALPLRTRRAASIVFRRPFSMADFRRELTFAAAADREESKQDLTDPGGLTNRTVTLLPNQRSAMVDGEQISLSQKEYDLLALLISCGDKGASTEQIDLCVGAGNTNQGQVYVCHLRKKLERTPGVRRIQTVRGWGYRLI